MATKCPKCDLDNPPDSKFCKECGTQLIPSEYAPEVTRTLETPVPKLNIGTVFANRYEILEELGKGGMGKVYRVRDEKLDEEMALKVLKPEIAAYKGTIERFKTELKLARKIAHKNVCKMYDLNEEGEVPYITMEYVEGEDLKSHIKEVGKLSEKEAVGLAQQVCEGLKEAHELGVVHRDMKPQNIMIDKNSRAKIMDFGIARSVEAAGLTQTGVMIGTPDYISPEQAEGEEADQRSDIYSLGVILYEMVTGTVPFKGDTAISVAVKHKTQLPQDPKKLNPSISDDLSRLILVCMEKDRERRYQTAEALLFDLQNIEDGLPLGTKMRPRRRTFASTLTRRKLLFPALAAITLVAIGVILWQIFQPREPAVAPGNPLLAVLPFENLGAPEDEYFTDGMTNEMTNRLSLLQGLDVIARAAAVPYKKTDKTIAQIRDELNVDYVVTGTVSWDKGEDEKGSIRIASQLIRASNSTQIWSGTYEMDLEDIFVVQSEIAERVAEQLDLTILEPERKGFYGHPTENLKAYDYYLKGLAHEDKAAKAGSDFSKELALAIQMHEKALEIDPKFMLAYGELSAVHAWLYSRGDMTEERLAKSKAALDKALELQPDSPYAQLALANYYYRGLRDYDRAGEILENVQKSNPNWASLLLGLIQRRLGKWDQSLETFERVIRRNPRESELYLQQGLTYLYLRRYEMADLYMDRCLEIAPEHLIAKINKIWIVLFSRGDIEEAKRMLEGLPDINVKAYQTIFMNLYERNYKKALEHLESIDVDTQWLRGFYFNKDLFYASIYYLQNQPVLVKTHAERAREDIENKLRERPKDRELHIALGKVYAYLGLKEEATRQGKLAVELVPVSKDAVEGPDYVSELANIYVIVGEYEEAINQIDYLLSIPSYFSVQLLRLDPVWDPLRQHPRFQQLLKKHSTS